MIERGGGGFGLAGMTLAQGSSLANFLIGAVIDGNEIFLSDLSINSLNSWANLGAAQSEYATFIGFLQGLGFTKIVLCTLPASSTFVAKQALRLQVNTWLRTVPLGITAVVDVATIIDDPVTPTQILPAYALPDGTHWNATGHAAVGVEIVNMIGPLF